MAASDKPKGGFPTKVPVEELITSRDSEDAFRVTYRTVKRWEEMYEWRGWKITPKTKRYHRTEVEQSLGVIFPRD